jgi:subfamily B ATP-binding cassette protein MsbA
MKLYLRIISYVKPYLSRLIIAAICTIFAAGGNLYIPWIMKDVIDDVLTKGDSQMLNLVVISIVIVFALRGVFYYGQSYLMSYVGEKVVIDIRSQIYRKLQNLSVSFYDKNKLGTIMSYVTNDVAALQNAMIQGTIELLTETAVLIGSISAMLYLSWKMTLFTLLTFPIVLFLMRSFGAKLRVAGGRIQQCTADITSTLQETLSSTRVVKSFVREEYEIGRFEKENKANFNANMKNAQLMAVLTPAIELVAAIGVSAIIWYGGLSVIEGEVTAGELIAFLVYAVNISNPIKRITRLIGSLQRALAASERVFSILDIEEDIKDKENALLLKDVKGEVKFDNVTFAYDKDEIVLKNLSFVANKGEQVALVGPSGAGKSTIANLLPRFYDVLKGKIEIDGIDIRNVKVDSLRENVGIVPQETTLFNGSVYNNILYGRLDATREEIIEAAKAANAHNFIMKFPNGYETMLGDRGLNLSGGQRQRIAIARAILKNPAVLVLDEATSALDTESERIVQEALERLMVGRTSIVIAHRLSTIKNADKILVIEKGLLKEMGSHEELLKKNGLYAYLYQIQYSKHKTEQDEYHEKVAKPVKEVENVFNI